MAGSTLMEIKKKKVSVSVPKQRFVVKKRGENKQVQKERSRNSEYKIKEENEITNEKIGKIKLNPKREKGGISKRGIVRRKIALRGCQCVYYSTTTENLP